MNSKTRSRLILVLFGVFVLACVGILGAVDLWIGNNSKLNNPPEGDHSVAALTGNASYALDPGDLHVAWNTGTVDPDVVMTWPREAGYLHNGSIRVAWGQINVQLAVQFRADAQPPVRLAENDTLARRNTFNVTYNESPTFSSLPADAILSFNSGTYFDYGSQESVDRTIGGDLHLDMQVECRGNRTLCPNGLDPHEVIIDGTFPATSVKSDLAADGVPGFAFDAVLASVVGAALLGWARRRDG
ncbi:MAG: hypothetical protein ACYDDF_11345 [Thermoplasmatota archaeon]